MKLIIDIPDNIYDAIKKVQTIISGQRSGKTLLQILVNSVENGIPLDDVKAKIQRTITASWYNGENYKKNYRDGLNDAIEILDNIGKAESGDVVVANKNLCDSCTTKDCIFQSGIVRNHCDFYRAESEVKHE